MFAVKAEKVNKYYKNGIHGKKEVLKNVSINIEEGEIFGIDALSEAEKVKSIVKK